MNTPEIPKNVPKKPSTDIQKLVKREARIEAGILTDEELKFYRKRDCVIETSCTASVREKFPGFDLIGWLLIGLFVFRSKSDPQHLKIARVSPETNEILGEENRF